MDILRNEIIEAQKVRSDLVKWKLFLVAVLGATGLGLKRSEKGLNPELVLCCIPFVCAYVDLLCRHLSLRIKGIGTFLRTVYIKNPKFSVFKNYEELMQKSRDNIRDNIEKWGFGQNKHSLESIVLKLSSIIFSMAIFSYAVLMTYKFRIPIFNGLFRMPIFSGNGYAIIICGLFGIFITIWLNINYRSRRRIIEASAGLITLFISSDISSKIVNQLETDLNEIFYFKKIYLMDSNFDDQYSFIFMADTLVWLILLKKASIIFLDHDPKKKLSPIHYITHLTLMSMSEAIKNAWDKASEECNNKLLKIGLATSNPDSNIFEIKTKNRDEIAQSVAQFVKDLKYTF